MPLTPQITLTATLLDYSGAPIGSANAPAYLRIALCGFGQTLPSIPGTGTIAKVASWPGDIPFTGALLTVLLWGNDVITPGPNKTYYSIAVLDANKNVVQSGAYQFSGTQTIDLSNAPQIYPVTPTPPGGTAVLTNPPGAALQTITGSLDIIGNLQVTGSITGGNFGIPSISATAPVRVNGGAGPVTTAATLSMPAATNAVNGYLTAADHTTFAAKLSPLAGAGTFGTDFIFSAAGEDSIETADGDVLALNGNFGVSLGSGKLIQLGAGTSGTDAINFGQLPAAKAAVTHQFLTAYSGGSAGTFTAAQPAFGDITGVATTGQLPTVVAYKNAANVFTQQNTFPAGVLYTSGGVAISSTPADPGAGNLNVENQISSDTLSIAGGAFFVTADGTTTCGADAAQFVSDGSGELAFGGVTWNPAGDITIGDGAILLNVDGSGFAGNGGIEWDNVGNLTLPPLANAVVIGADSGGALEDNSGKVCLIGGTPTIAAQTGAGTGPAVSITGTDLAHIVSVTTGTGPAASANIVTVTFSVYRNHNVAPTFSPVNANAAALTGTSAIYVNTAGSVSYTLVANAALAASTTYLWAVQTT